jgi:hypothetical protein
MLLILGDRFSIEFEETRGLRVARFCFGHDAAEKDWPGEDDACG